MKKLQLRFQKSCNFIIMLLWWKGEINVNDAPPAYVEEYDEEQPAYSYDHRDITRALDEWWEQSRTEMEAHDMPEYSREEQRAREQQDTARILGGIQQAQEGRKREIDRKIGAVDTTMRIVIAVLIALVTGRFSRRKR